MLYIHWGRDIGTDILPSKFQVYQLVKQKKAIAFRTKGLMIAEDKGLSLSQWNNKGTHAVQVSGTNECNNAKLKMPLALQNFC